MRSTTPAMKAILLFVMLALLRILVFQPESAADPASRESVMVNRVIDGDTIHTADGRRIRLLGIDAPECGFDGSPPEPWAFEAAEWLRNRIEGQVVTLRIDSPEPDRYQRTLAWIYDTDGTLINQQLLALGHARLLDRFGLPFDLEPVLRAAESEARIRRLGLWAPGGRSERVVP